MTPLDLESLKFRRTTKAPRTDTRPPPRHRPGERFLKGPIPLSWLKEAAQLPGKALHVALMLWYQSGLTRSREVDLSLSNMATMGVHRSSASRGLRALEEARLVSVVRAPGRKPQVTILEFP